MFKSPDSRSQDYCSAVQILINYGRSGLQQDLLSFFRESAQFADHVLYTPDDLMASKIHTLLSAGVICSDDIRPLVCLYTMVRSMAEEIDILYREGFICREDVAFLAKAITEAEAQYLTLTGCSLTGSHNRIFSVREYIPIDALEWIYKNATNPYIPFGTNGRCRRHAKSISEYNACQEELRMEKPRAQRMRLEQLERKRAEGRARFTEMHEIQGERSAARNMCIDHLRVMTAMERLEGIARDKGTSIAYYPDEFAEFRLTLLEQLDPALRTSLLLKVSRAKGGRWRQLWEQINTETQGRATESQSGTTADE